MKTQIKMPETARCIRRSGLITLIYLLVCAFYAGVLFFESVYSGRTGAPVSILIMPLWMLNPMALFSSIRGIETYLDERKYLHLKKSVWQKCFPFVLYILCATAAWAVSTVLFIEITGGV